MTTTASPRTLIALGPTQEPIDDVRFISNRSSGRMGLALAAEVANRGWPLTVLMGPVCPPPDLVRLGPNVLRFRTAAELDRLLRETWPGHDLLLMVAAVADHRPARPTQGKLRRSSSSPLMIEFEPVPDLLAGLAPMTRPDQCAVGFALEPPAELRESALAKLQRKRLRGIVANALETMDADEIEATLLLDDGRTLRPQPRRMGKQEFAVWLLDQCAALVDRSRSR